MNKNNYIKEYINDIFINNFFIFIFNNLEKKNIIYFIF